MTPDSIPQPLETKAADANLDVDDAFDDFMRSFEAFKESNDERLVAA